MRPPWRFEGEACECECGTLCNNGNVGYFWRVWDLESQSIVETGNVYGGQMNWANNCMTKYEAEVRAAQAALEHEVKFRNAQRVQEDQLKTLRAGGSVPVGI